VKGVASSAPSIRAADVRSTDVGTSRCASFPNVGVIRSPQSAEVRICGTLQRGTLEVLRLREHIIAARLHRADLRQTNACRIARDVEQVRYALSRRLCIHRTIN